MSNEFKSEAASARVVKIMLISPDGKWWNGSTFETYSSVNIANYLLTQTEQGVSGVYLGNFPVTITTPGLYQYFSYYADPFTEGDPSVSSGKVEWTGSQAAVPAGDIAASLLSLNEAKQFLKISVSSEDDIVTMLCVAGTAMINNYCDRDFIQSQKTEYYHGNGERSMLLRSYPVASIDSLHIDSTRQWGAASQVTVASDLILDGPAGFISLWNNRYSFSKGFYNVKAVYTSGYLFASLPTDLKMAARIVLAQQYKRLYQDQRIGITSETIGDRNMTYTNEDIPKTAKLILDRYINRGPAVYAC